ncbi:21 kDa seed protein, putative [Theobroma cacao]|uniref:21 kDa seed protein, putative n=1 Tax=Theobroma cacao TaxID=3641 RepID=A0A061DZT4_THECC|nr:21 kDa seed protein, putative [Theobroma cacao]
MMKTTLAMLLLLLFVFLSKSSAADEDGPVYDLNSDELCPGVEYYVVPAIWGAGGGGLYLGKGRNQTCPYDVVQEKPALPVTFSPVDTKGGVIHGSADLNIRFIPPGPTACSQSTVWEVDSYDGSRGECEIGRYSSGFDPLIPLVLSDNELPFVFIKAGHEVLKQVVHI